MITIFTIKNNPFTQNIYNEMLNDLPIHQLPCTCGQRGTLIKHAYYKRSVKYAGKLVSIKILRVICKSCMKTHAVLPDILVPYSAILLKDHIKIINAYSNKKSFDHIMIHNYLIDEGHIRYIIKNYNKYWRERLSAYSISLDSDLVKSCFNFFKRQFMQIKRTSNIYFLKPT